MDIGLGEVALHRGHGGNGAAQTAVAVPAAAEQAGFVEMDMAVDEAGDGKAPAEIDFGRVGCEAGRNGDDAPRADPDVHRLIMTGDAGSAEDEIESGGGRHEPAGRLAYN
jgi:hypothetical protein